jgi:iron(III) transport system substrate-binding protein
MRYLFIAFTLLLAACTSPSAPEQTTVQEVNVYSHRHYDIDQALFEQFTKETGIKVNVVNASADELLVRMQTEGENCPADLLITSDAGRLVRAADMNLLQASNSEIVNQTVAPYLRSVDNLWTALTVRARVLAYAPERVDTSLLRSYEDLANPIWKGKVLTRTSNNIYNQSLLASIIANDGDSMAIAWAAGVKANFARDPQGNDRDQVKAIAAGEGDIAIVNTYYVGKMLASDNAAEREAAESVKMLFPNQNNRGTHINISGAGVAKYAPNKDNALKLIEFLLRKDVQQQFADANYEYPVNKESAASDLLKNMGSFTEDRLPLENLGKLNSRSVEIYNEVGWN